MGFINYLITGFIIISLVAFVNYAVATNLVGDLTRLYDSHTIKDENLTIINTRYSCVHYDAEAGRGISADSLKMDYCDFKCKWDTGSNSYYSYECINNDLICKCKKPYIAPVNNPDFVANKGLIPVSNTVDYPTEK